MVLSVQKSLPGSNVKSGSVVKGVIVRVVARLRRRDDGSYVRFDRNAVVLVDNDGNPRVELVFSVRLLANLRDRKFMRIVSLASEVV